MKKRHDLQIAVARRLSALRQARGMTQEGVANRLNIASQNIQRIESGRQNLTLQTVERVAGAIGVAVEEVLQVAAGAGSRPRFLDLDRAGVLRANPRPPVPLPVFRIVDAARFARGATTTPLGWLVLADDVEAGCFVTRVEGGAMEPRLPDGSWHLFRPLRQAAAARSIVLVELGGPDGGEALVRRLDGDEGGTLRLASLQAGDPPLVLGPSDGRVVAEHVRTVAVDG